MPERIFDADVHIYPPSPETLMGYMEAGDRAALSQFDMSGGTGYVFPRSGQRLDAIPPDGPGMAGTSPAFLIEDHVERHAIDLALLTPSPAATLSRYPNPDVAAAVARATNDWMRAEWLSADERLLGSIVVATADPQQAAEEIRRVAVDPRIVQVYTASPPWLLGDRAMHPIYAACEETGLAFTLHVGGGDIGVSLGNKGGVAYATTYCEAHIEMCIPALGHVISLVNEGVFERFPGLRVLISECGTAWLPFVMWRMDMEYLQGREDVPWLSKPPSEYIAEHLRFTTQPFEEPPRRGDLVTLLDMVGGDRLLVFSSDYPHFDADTPRLIERRLPESWREPVFYGNAARLFDLERRFAATARGG